MMENKNLLPFEKVEEPNILLSEQIFGLKLDGKRRLYFLPSEWLDYENTGHEEK
jgi:hypothetical protein